MAHRQFPPTLDMPATIISYPDSFNSYLTPFQFAPLDLQQHLDPPMEMVLVKQHAIFLKHKTKIFLRLPITTQMKPYLCRTVQKFHLIRPRLSFLTSSHSVKTTSPCLLFSQACHPHSFSKASYTCWSNLL